MKEERANISGGTRWSDDGALGPKDPNTSISILIRWLSEEGNYNKFRGGSANKGQTKLSICEGIAKQINGVGVRVHRDGKSVQNKITDLEDQMRKAIDWSEGTETGAGLKESDVGTWHDQQLLRCRYYDELYPIFKDRAGFVPKMTTDDPEFENEGISGSGKRVGKKKKRASGKSAAEVDGEGGGNGDRASGANPSSQKTKHTKRGQPDPVDNLLEQVLSAKLKKYKADADPVALMEKKMRRWAAMVKHMGGDKVKVVLHCPEMEEFLEDDEVEELARRKAHRRENRSNRQQSRSGAEEADESERTV